MQWEHLTVPDFAKAVEACGGVAILPVGVIEPHGAHLPLGQDALAVHRLACDAAEREPAIVFPLYPWGINHEAAHLPGAVVLKRDLVLQLLENVCDEMARNGLKKIILINGHGGNRFALPLFVQTYVEKHPDYAVYFARLPFLPGTEGLLETSEIGHACEAETSEALHLFSELVQMEAVPQPFTELHRGDALREAGGYSPMDWYSMYPTMYVGDATKATAEKGRVICEQQTQNVVRLIKAVKDDTVTPQLLAEFLDAGRHPRSAY